MTRYTPVSTRLNLPATEHAVLEHWERDHTFEKSVAKRAGGPLYAFDDGPPFATGLPHYGDILTSYIKDVVPRYFTMRGYHVPRRWGWDCHGLPVEYEVEKELGLTGPHEIAALGLDRFTEECRSLVLRYAKEWESIYRVDDEPGRAGGASHREAQHRRCSRRDQASRTCEPVIDREPSAALKSSPLPRVSQP
jgi:isoleucyl-tRNA synthetase